MSLSLSFDRPQRLEARAVDQLVTMPQAAEVVRSALGAASLLSVLDHKRAFARDAARVLRVVTACAREEAPS